MSGRKRQEAPPQNLDAERAVLSSILINGDAIDVARAVLGDDASVHFMHPPHAAVYEMMVSMRRDGEPVDVVLLASRFDRCGRLAEIGGMSFLSELLGAQKTSAHVRDYAVMVRDVTLRRELQALLRSHYLASKKSDSGADSIIDGFILRLESLMRGMADADFIRMSDTLPELRARMLAMLDRGREAFGISTGIGNLDAILLGLEPGSVTVLACRPGVGKSTLSLQIASHVARAHGNAAIVSLEMSREQIEDKAAYMLGGISRREVLNRYIARDALERKIEAVCSDAALERLYILDCPAITSNDLRLRMKRFADRRGIALLVIDYLQLLRPANTGASRYEQVSEMSRTIKLLAREIGAPVLLLSQLNRDGADRPRLHNLRESGAIEQDADNVILMWPENEDGIMHVDVAKHRTGATGECGLFFRSDTQKFFDADLPKPKPRRGRRGGANDGIIQRVPSPSEYDFTEPDEECPF
jgi:replicative DNA helicase